MNEDTFRKAIREVINEILDEAIATSMDDYDSKQVFRGKSNKNKKDAKDTATTDDMKLTKHGKDNIKKDPSSPGEEGHDEWWDDDTNEISTTAGAGGYETPNAYTKSSKLKDKEDVEEKMRKIAQQSGYELAEVKRLVIKEARGRYYRFKTDQSRTAKQKIGELMRDVKQSVREIDKQLKILSRYKNEFDYSSDNYWKTTRRDIYRVEEQLKSISQKLRELKS